MLQLKHHDWQQLQTDNLIDNMYKMSSIAFDYLQGALNGKDISLFCQQLLPPHPVAMACHTVPYASWWMATDELSLWQQLQKIRQCCFINEWQTDNTSCQGHLQAHPVTQTAYEKNAEGQKCGGKESNFYLCRRLAYLPCMQCTKIK